MKLVDIVVMPPKGSSKKALAALAKAEAKAAAEANEKAATEAKHASAGETKSKEGDAKKKQEDVDSRYGEEAYIAQGKPMFTRLWSYEELLAAERPLGKGRRNKSERHDVEKPAKWPADTEVERGSWVYWLPEGWIQGIRTQIASGKKLSCYMSPEGKRFWHKPSVEKYLGRKLESIEKRPVAKSGEDGDGDCAPKVRYVSDPDAIPVWPEDDDKLPRDWKVGFRQLPSRLHRIYVPPGHDDIGFFYHTPLVKLYIETGLPAVSPFGTSKPMAEISSLVKEHGIKKKRKRGDVEHEEAPTQVTAVDYEASQLAVVPLPPLAAEPMALHAAIAAASAREDVAKELSEAAQAVDAALVTRGFEKGTQLLAVFDRTAGTDAARHPLSKRLCGIYHARPAQFNDRPFYQQIFLLPRRQGLGCHSLYVAWSTRRGAWKICERLDEEVAGLSVGGAELEGSEWKVLKRELLCHGEERLGDNT